MASAIDPTKPEDDVPAVKAELRFNLETARAELNHGGFAEGFVPVNYAPPAGTEVQAHLAAIDSALGTLGGGAAGLSGWIDAIVDRGATGDGSTDDTAALQAALDSGAAVVYLPPGVYHVTAALTVTPGTKIVGAGAEKSILVDRRTAPGDGNGLITCTGSTVALPQVASAMARGAAGCVFAAAVASTLDHGDWIRFVDTTNGSMDTIYEDGFTAQVQGIAADGASVDLMQTVMRALPAARTAGPLGAVTATKIDQRGLILEDFCIRGLTYALGPGDDVTETQIGGVGVYCTDLANIHLQRMLVEGHGTFGVNLLRCAGITIDNSWIGMHCSTQSSGLVSYGLSIWSSAHGRISNSVFYAPRHAVDFQSQHNSGPSHSWLVTNSVMMAGGNSSYQLPQGQGVVIALDWHEGTFDTRIHSCAIYGSVAIRGHDHHLRNCLVVTASATSPGQGVFVGFNYGPGFATLISGCEIVVQQDYWNGSVVRIGGATPDDPGLDTAEGTFEFTNNRIWIKHDDATTPLITLTDSTAKSPDWGQIKISGNHVIVSDSSGTQPFVDINVTNGQSLEVVNNKLSANMSIGSWSGFTETYVGPNFVGGFTQYDSLPTSNPGGSGRLWSDGGTLKIT